LIITSTLSLLYSRNLRIHLPAECSHYTPNAGTLDCDYIGEIIVVLANMSNQDYQIQKDDQIMQLITEKPVQSNRYVVPKFAKPNCGQQRFRSTGISNKLICQLSAKAFRKFYCRSDSSRGIR